MTQQERRTLEPSRARGAAGEILVTRSPGYLLRVESGMLDAMRFEELTATARQLLSDRNRDAEAASMLREALGLWRGQAFEEFGDTEFGAAEANRLEELRLVAVEDRVEADLRLGPTRRPRPTPTGPPESGGRDDPVTREPWRSNGTSARPVEPDAQASAGTPGLGAGNQLATVAALVGLASDSIGSTAGGR